MHRSMHPTLRIITTSLLLAFLSHSTTRAGHHFDGDDDRCTVCQDGSPITRPDGIIEFDGEEWRCGEISQILWLLNVTADCPKCNDLHYLGFLECGCPYFEDNNYCALCPRRFQDLPDPDKPIPNYEHMNLTCQDIIFVPRDDPNVTIPCNDLERYRKLCQCPEICSFCRYSDENPAAGNLDLVIPYLTEGDKQVTCLEYVTKASDLFVGESCDEYRTPPVPVNLEGYCGCPRISPPNLCSLCPDGVPLRDPDMVIANVGGLTCSELEFYLQYVTDLDTCVGISDRSQACCEVFDLCPLCEEGTAYGAGSGKVYDPYNLGCDQIGQATHFGFDSTCENAQLRFPYYCRCADAIQSNCTICPLNQVPPEPSRFIPYLNITCGEANDLVSLSSNSSECAEVLDSFNIDVAGFCGCGTDTSLFGRCEFCPEGTEQRYQVVIGDGPQLENIFAISDGTISQTQYESTFAPPFAPGNAAYLPYANLFGSAVDPDKLPTQGQQCLGFEAIAPYVIEGEFCKMVQESVPICCRSQGTVAPTASSQPTFLPSEFPTVEPTIMMTNASFWDNYTDYNSTNETEAPTFAPTASPLPAPTVAEEDSSAWTNHHNHRKIYYSLGNFLPSAATVILLYRIL